MSARIRSGWIAAACFALAALCTWGATAFAQIGGPIVGGGASRVANITSGTITGTNVPYTLSKSGVPMVKAGSGTMANNGVATFTTALPRTLSGGAWWWMPAGSVAAGVPATAQWLWGVASSTTVVTLFNSQYSTGTPGIGTATPFVTTGPGAFAGDTAEITGPTITLPAGAMGLSGWLDFEMIFTPANSAGAKTVKFKFGGTTFISETITSLPSASFVGFLFNTGVASSQIGVPNTTTSHAGVGNGGGVSIASAIDTMGTSPSITITMTGSGAATDFIILEGFKMMVTYGL